MDRFIVAVIWQFNRKNLYLKSNMDRFIVCHSPPYKISSLHLKSNMDRFIENIAEYQLMFAVI